jgi:hypothetical protein
MFKGVKVPMGFIISMGLNLINVLVQEKMSGMEPHIKLQGG